MFDIHPADAYTVNVKTEFRFSVEQRDEGFLDELTSRDMFVGDTWLRDGVRCSS